MNIPLGYHVFGKSTNPRCYIPYWYILLHFDKIRLFKHVNQVISSEVCLCSIFREKTKHKNTKSCNLEPAYCTGAHVEFSTNPNIGIPTVFSFLQETKPK